MYNISKNRIHSDKVRVKIILHDPIFSTTLIQSILDTQSFDKI